MGPYSNVQLLIFFATHEVSRGKIETVTDEDVCDAIFNMISNEEVETVKKPRLPESPMFRAKVYGIRHGVR